MSEVGALVEAAWRDGVGPDDRARLDGALALDDVGGDGALDRELALFAAACRLICGERAALPAPPPDGAGAVVHAAAAAIDAALARDAAAIERTARALGDALAALPDDAPHELAAEAWTDLALGEVALVAGERRVAHRRYTAATAPDRPIALRLAAMSRLVELAIGRRDFAAARDGARKAAALAAARGRPIQATRAQLACGLLDLAAGDLAAMRETLAPLSGEPVARLLLATDEPAERSLALLADALRDAIERDDTLTYALCVLLGAQRYRALGRDEDARTILAVGSGQLTTRAPALAEALAEELAHHDEALYS